MRRSNQLQHAQGRGVYLLAAMKTAALPLLLAAAAAAACLPTALTAVTVAFEPPVLVGSSSTTHYWFPAHLARSSLSNPQELVVTAQNRGDAATVAAGNITEFLISKNGGQSWSHLLQDGPPEYAHAGRAHEQGTLVGPDQTGQDGLVVVGLEGWADPAAPANASGGGGRFTIPAATLSSNGSVLSRTNMTMANFPQLASADGLAMGDNAIRLRSGTWLMLSYGFAAPTAGCIVAGPPGKNCMYTLYVMAGAPGSEADSSGDRPNDAAAGVAASGFPTRWEYRASISDPQRFGEIPLSSYT